MRTTLRETGVLCVSGRAALCFRRRFAQTILPKGDHLGLFPVPPPRQDVGGAAGGGGGDREQLCFLPEEEAGEGERLSATRVGH